MKILVVYATKTGCTEDYARRIGATLRDAGGDVRVIPVESAPPARGFDAVVVGSGVRAGKWHKPATDWVVANAAALSKMPVALFTCCLTMKDGRAKASEVLGYTAPMLKATGLTPRDIGLFAGWFEPGKFGFLEKTILKAMKTPQGDFRDLAQAAAWATDIAPRLGLGVKIYQEG